MADRWDRARLDASWILEDTGAGIERAEAGTDALVRAMGDGDAQAVGLLLIWAELRDLKELLTPDRAQGRPNG